MTTPPKGRADYLALGDWNVVCYECGRKRKASYMKRHWQGYYVCPEHWEVRHPQDFVRGIADVQTPPWTQPMPPDEFVPINYTEYPADFLPLSEADAKEFVKNITPPVPGHGAVNTFAVNSVAVNGVTALPPDFEVLVLTEVVEFVLGRSFSDALGISEGFSASHTKDLSEPLPLGETVAENETEGLSEPMGLIETLSVSITHNISETLGVAESVTSVRTSARTVNGAAVNTLSVG